jgi:FAD/FMN-containing dehydrogenase
MADFLAELGRIVGAARVLTSAADVASFCTDWRGRYTGKATCVVLPGTTEEVSAVVRICAAAGTAIVPQGGNTGLCGGATPTGGEVVIVLTRLNRIRAVDADNNSITVEAGCTLQAVQQAAQEIDRLFPLSLAAEGSATIGGNLATNAGGVQVLRYGNARELTLGLEVVLADGRVWNGLRALRKDNTGYDLKHLFIGAEGTLGLITAATLKLFPRPRTQAAAWVAVPDPAAAVSLLGRLRDAAGDNVTAFEIVGRPALELVLRHIPDARVLATIWLRLWNRRCKGPPRRASSTTQQSPPARRRLPRYGLYARMFPRRRRSKVSRSSMTSPFRYRASPSSLRAPMSPCWPHFRRCVSSASATSATATCITTCRGPTPSPTPDSSPRRSP